MRFLPKRASLTPPRGRQKQRNCCTTWPSTLFVCFSSNSNRRGRTRKHPPSAPEDEPYNGEAASAEPAPTTSRSSPRQRQARSYADTEDEDEEEKALEDEEEEALEDEEEEGEGAEEGGEDASDREQGLSAGEDDMDDDIDDATAERPTSPVMRRSTRTAQRRRTDGNDGPWMEDEEEEEDDDDDWAASRRRPAGRQPRGRGRPPKQHGTAKRTAADRARPARSNKDEARHRREQHDAQLRTNDDRIRDMVNAYLPPNVQCAEAIQKADALLRLPISEVPPPPLPDRRRTVDEYAVRLKWSTWGFSYLPDVFSSYAVQGDDEKAAKLGFDVKSRSPYGELPNANLFSPLFLVVDVRTERGIMSDLKFQIFVCSLSTVSSFTGAWHFQVPLAGLFQGLADQA